MNANAHVSKTNGKKRGYFPKEKAVIWHSIYFLPSHQKNGRTYIDGNGRGVPSLHEVLEKDASQPLTETEQREARLLQLKELQRSFYYYLDGAFSNYLDKSDRISVYAYDADGLKETSNPLFTLYLTNGVIAYELSDYLKIHEKQLWWIEKDLKRFIDAKTKPQVSLLPSLPKTAKKRFEEVVHKALRIGVIDLPTSDRCQTVEVKEYLTASPRLTIGCEESLKDKLRNNESFCDLLQNKFKKYEIGWIRSKVSMSAEQVKEVLYKTIELYAGEQSKSLKESIVEVVLMSSKSFGIKVKDREFYDWIEKNDDRNPFNYFQTTLQGIDYECKIGYIFLSNEVKNRNAEKNRSAEIEKMTKAFAQQHQIKNKE